MSDPMSDRDGTDLAHLFQEHTLNAILASIGCIILSGVALRELARGEIRWGWTVLFVAVLAILPGPFYRSLTTTLPWELVALVTAAVGWRSVAPASEFALFAVIAGAAILIAAELQLFTSTRMSHRFVVLLVAIATAAVAGAWALIGWAADWYFGTRYITTNPELMGDLIAASMAGLIAGVVFDLYVRWWEARLDRLTPLLTDHGGRTPDE